MTSPTYLRLLLVGFAIVVAAVLLRVDVLFVFGGPVQLHLDYEPGFHWPTFAVAAILVILMLLPLLHRNAVTVGSAALGAAIWIIYGIFALWARA